MKKTVLVFILTFNFTFVLNAQETDYKLTLHNLNTAIVANNTDGLSINLKQYSDSATISQGEIQDWFKISFMKDFNSIKSSNEFSSLLKNEEYTIKSFNLGINIQNMYKETKNVGCYLDDNTLNLLRNNKVYTLVFISDIVLVNNKTGEESTSNEKLKITIK
jgi:hypothetical protein